MNTLIKSISLATAVTLISTSAFAGNKHHRHDDDYRHNNAEYGYSHDRGERARVVDVAPIYSYVRDYSPQRECWRQPRRDNRYQSYTSTIAGGLIGGVIGNQFGGGSGNTAMTVAGTLLGGSVGRDLGQNNYHETRYEERCDVREHSHERRVLDGYHVTYRYQGQLYTTRMDHHPGKFIPVDVHVRPKHGYY